MSAPYIHSSKRRRGFQSPAFKVGLPFMVFMIAGQFFLTSFLSGRYEEKSLNQEWVNAENQLKKKKPVAEGLTDEQRKGTNQKNLEPKPEFDLNAEYEKMMKKIDLDSWDNVRVPRPEQIHERTISMKDKTSGK